MTIDKPQPPPGDQLPESGQPKDQTAANRTAAGGAAGDGPAGDRPSTPATSSDVVAGTTPQATKKPSAVKKQLRSDRPADAPPDPWAVFAATSERPPGWLRRAVRAVRHAVLHEYALVTYVAVLLAVALTWPILRNPLHTLPHGLGGAARQAWQIAWAGHILQTAPEKLWQSNAFYPEPYSFAFGDSLLGYAPAGMIGDGPLAATLRYNILFVLAHALMLIGGYALTRQLGAGRTAAAVAAVAVTYAPWRLAQDGHLDIVSAGGIPLALAMIARGHGWSLRRGFRRSRRNAGWAAVGWLVAAWQVSLGFSLGLPLLGVLGILVVVLVIAVPIRRLRRPAERPVLGARLLTVDGLGVVFVAAVAALIALPYLRSSGSGSATTEINSFSPPLRALLIGPAESRIWGASHAVARSALRSPSEMALLPGFVLYGLALAGLVFSIWTLRQRLLLLAALAGTVILTLGTTFFGGRWTYLPLFGHLPAAVGVRVPGRLMLWCTLLLAVLAAGAVADFVRRAKQVAAHRIPPWPSPWLRLAALVPLLLVLAEGWHTTAASKVPTQPRAMRTVSGAMVVLPTDPNTDQLIMLWSTSRFQPMANGASGFASARQAELRRVLAEFPDQPTIEFLRTRGITTVLLVRALAPGTVWERAGDIPVDALGISREDVDGAVLFHLDRPPTQPTAPLQPGPPSPGQLLPGQPLPGQSGQPILPGQSAAPGQAAISPQPGSSTPPGSPNSLALNGQASPSQLNALTVPNPPRNAALPANLAPQRPAPG